MSNYTLWSRLSALHTIIFNWKIICLFWLLKWLSGQRMCLPMQETQEMQVRILRWEDTLEKEMATGSSIVGWRILWTEEPGNYNPWSPKESDMTQHPCMLILQIKRLRTVMLKVTWLELSCHSFHFFFLKAESLCYCQLGFHMWPGRLIS